MSDKVYVGSNVSSMVKKGEFEPVSRVTMWYDDEHYYTAGDDAGRALEIDNPWATQEMANEVLSNLKGYVYRPFDAADAALDPAAELGDAVTVGGIYSVLAHSDQRFDAGFTADISAPGEKEVDHEYPYLDPQERELKRRVKLGQKYQGVSITRRDGLTIVETDGETEGAKVVLNSKELSFYDAASQRVLYFDPVTGTYKFTGVLNVADNFIVDKDGNVTIKGNLNLSTGVIYWGDNPPNKKRYAASTGGPWHDTMQDGDLYCCDWDYSADDWGPAYKFKGEDGKNGADGNDADVTYSNIKTALNRASKAAMTIVDGSSIDTVDIYANNIYGGNLYAGDGVNTFANVNGNGFDVCINGISTPKIRLYCDDDGTSPQIQLGSGDNNNNDIFYLLKGANAGTIIYWSANGNSSGFRFTDGKITPIGDLDVTARFG